MSIQASQCKGNNLKICIEKIISWYIKFTHTQLAKLLYIFHNVRLPSFVLSLIFIIFFATFDLYINFSIYKSYKNVAQTEINFEKTTYNCKYKICLFQKYTWEVSFKLVEMCQSDLHHNLESNCNISPPPFCP